jgi:hypothetical protein
LLFNKLAAKARRFPPKFLLDARAACRPLSGSPLRGRRLHQCPRDRVGANVLVAASAWR